jgi:hypothetical protein
MKNKCHFCNKKLKLYEKNIQCNCGNCFCMKHINKHSHNCKFINHNKEKNKLIISNNNPKLSSNKLIKI